MKNKITGYKFPAFLILFLILVTNLAYAVSLTGGDTGTPNVDTLLMIGDSGAGTFTINAGSSAFPTIVNSSDGAYIGNTISGNGLTTILGSGAEWNVGGGFGTGLRVGNQGFGNLSILGGGTVNSNFSRIGNHAGSFGETTVFGLGSTWNVSQQLQIGSTSSSWGILNVRNNALVDVNEAIGINGGRGEIHISTGGRVKSGEITFLAITPTSEALVSVRDSGSILSFETGLALGLGGRAEMNIANGGQVIVNHGMGIGGFNGSSGNVAIDGSSSSLSSGLINIAGNDGIGSLTVSNGGKAQAPNINVFSNGSIFGNGTLVGSVANVGGFIAPGLSPGILTIDGDFSMSAGTLGIEIGGLNPGEFDILEVLGNAEFTGGTIDFSFVDDFVPQAGDVVDFLRADTFSIFDDVTFAFSGVGDGFLLGIDPMFGANGGLQFTALNDATEPVPEPSTILLLGSGLFGLIGYNYRRQKQAV